jgi:hypothetical protein
MSRGIVTRSQTRELGSVASTQTRRTHGYFDDYNVDETAFESFTAGRSNMRTSTPTQRQRTREDTPPDHRNSGNVQGEGDETAQHPLPPPANPDPVPAVAGDQGPQAAPGPPDGPPDGDDDGDDNGSGDGNPMAPGDRLFFDLSRAIADLARSTRIAHLPAPPPDPPSRTKVREPDQFDGSDPRKLRTFFVQCQINFQDRPRAFLNDTAKVTYALSYLHGAALDWFEPDLLRGPHARRPPWMDDFTEFSFELERNFGPHDPVGDAEHQLANLSMRDGQRINKYIVEFNRHASQVRGYGEGALRTHFYSGLPDRIKDEISRVGKPDSLYVLRDLAQSIDARYWERKSEITRQSKPTPSTSKPYERNFDKPSFAKSATPSASSSSASGNKAAKDRTSGGKPYAKTDLSSKLGKDGKLTKEERQRRFENNLCMFCGKSGHVARDCYKSASRAAKARAARPASPGAEPEASDEAKN